MQDALNLNSYLLGENLESINYGNWSITIYQTPTYIKLINLYVTNYQKITKIVIY